jgi:hypothetical protein
MLESTIIDPQPGSSDLRKTPAAGHRLDEDLADLFDPKARFELLADTRARVRVKLGEEVLRLVQDVQRPLFHQIGQRYHAQLLELDSYPEYLELLDQVLREAEERFRADPLIGAAGLTESAPFETMVRLMKVQLSAYLETLL